MRYLRYGVSVNFRKWKNPFFSSRGVLPLLTVLCSDWQDKAMIGPSWSPTSKNAIMKRVIWGLETPKMMMTSFSNSPQRDIKQYISIYHVTVRTNSRRREEVHCSVSRPPPTVLPVNLQMGGCCSEATFHSVSFPYQIQFGLEKIHPKNM